MVGTESIVLREPENTIFSKNNFLFLCIGFRIIFKHTTEKLKMEIFPLTKR